MTLRNGFTLGDWTVFPLEGRLTLDGVERRVQPKTMDVLLHLAEHAPAVVERDELLERVWRGRAQSDEPLTRCIGELRRALDDKRDAPRYIQTIPKRGYRLLPDVVSLELHAGPPDQVEPARDDAAATTKADKPLSRRPIRTIIAGIAILFAAAIIEITFERAIDNAVDETGDVPAGIDMSTEQKVDELLTLLMNQAAASGVALDIESQVVIENAVRAIVTSANSEKQAALAHLERGDVQTAAEMLTAIATDQASAVSQTGDAAAETWREAGALFYSFDFEQALSAYETADRLQPGNSETLDLLGYALIRADRRDDALEVFERILALEPAAPPADISSAQTGIGHIARDRGDYPRALEYMLLAQQTAASNDLAEEEALALMALSGLSRAQGDIDRSVEHLERSLTLATEIGNERYRAASLEGLGINASRRQQFDQAEDYLQRALRIKEQNNNLAGRVTVLANLGAVALARADLDRAEELLQQSVELKTRLNWRSGLAYDLSNLGGIALARGDFDAADDSLRRAEEIARELDLAELLPSLVFNRGEVAHERGDNDTACRFWREAAPALEAMGSPYVNDARERLDDERCD